ncbi:elongation factor 2 [Trichonephila clavipes]|nr:elongation factor 2 [Trichonephila clavipes]
MYESKDKTITPNLVPVKKDSLQLKEDKKMTVSPVVKGIVELQHPSDLSESENSLKILEKPDPMIHCITEETYENIFAGTEELHIENCLKDVKEDHAFISLKKAEPVVFVPESVPKEVRRIIREKRRPSIIENKDYYFIPKFND